MPPKANGKAKAKATPASSSSAVASGSKVPKAPAASTPAKRGANAKFAPPLPPPRKEEEEDQLAGDTDDEDYSESEGEEDPRVFRIRRPLNPPKNLRRTILEIHGLLHSETIDVDAPYQRGLVWDKAKKIKLIDSIFRNYHIPPLVFAVKDDGTMVCVDGKQRLNSIQEFMDTTIYHMDKKTGKKWYYALPANKKNETAKMGQIPPEAKQEFESKTLACIEYHGISDAVERDIFQRVQLGTPLTSAEKQNAIDSPWSEFVRLLCASYVTSEGGFGKYINWQTSRNRDFQTIGYLVMVAYHFPTYITPTSAKLTAFLSQQDRPEQKFKLLIVQYIKIFFRLVSEPEFNHPFTRPKWPKVSPVEVVYIGALISHMHTTDLTQLSKEVMKLREHVRSKHADLRLNERCSRTLHDYITSLPSRIVNDTAGTGGVGGAKGKKRKAADTDLEDRDYRPSPLPGRRPGF